MLDMFGIVVSTIAIIYVAIRASQLDRTLPWFEEHRDRHNRDLPDEG